MNKYDNGKIYKIVFPDGKFYVGSTVCLLGVRLTKHKNHYKSWKDGKYHNVSIFEYFDRHGFENCNIQLIENYPCHSKIELERREGEIILFHKMLHNESIVNKVVAGRSRLEWQRTVGSERHDCICGGYYTINHKGRHFASPKHLNAVIQN